MAPKVYLNGQELTDSELAAFQSTTDAQPEPPAGPFIKGNLDSVREAYDAGFTMSEVNHYTRIAWQKRRDNPNARVLHCVGQHSDGSRFRFRFLEPETSRAVDLMLGHHDIYSIEDSKEKPNKGKGKAKGKDQQEEEPNKGKGQ